MILVVNKFSTILFAALLLLGAGCQRESKGPEVITLTGKTMGTTYHIKYVLNSNSKVPLDKKHPAATKKQIQQQVSKRLQVINSQMSTYQKDSSLSLFNHDLKKKEALFPKDLRFVVKEALRLGVTSEGALDVTVGPLVELWGFGTKKTNSKVPTKQEIKDAKARTGLQKIFFIGEVLKVTDKKLQIDLSSIAKGYAVDEVSLLLERAGYLNYLVEIGGEIRTNGHKQNQKNWVVGIEKPDEQGRSLQRALPLFKNAMATSGDYRNYFRDQGRKYSHMINPETGMPVTHAMASVSVIHNSCMTADGWATAFMAMGPKKAMEIATKNQLAILMLVKEGKHFEEKMSPEFKKLISPMAH